MIVKKIVLECNFGELDCDEDSTIHKINEFRYRYNKFGQEIRKNMFYWYNIFSMYTFGNKNMNNNGF